MTFISLHFKNGSYYSVVRMDDETSFTKNQKISVFTLLIFALSDRAKNFFVKKRSPKCYRVYFILSINDQSSVEFGLGHLNLDLPPLKMVLWRTWT